MLTPGWAEVLIWKSNGFHGVILNIRDKREQPSENNNAVATPSMQSLKGTRASKKADDKSTRCFVTEERIEVRQIEAKMQ